MRGLLFLSCLSVVALSVATPATLSAQLSSSTPQTGAGLLAASSSAADLPLSQIHPPPPPDYELTGDILTARKQYSAALQAYAQAEHLSASAWNRRGIDYQMLLDLRDAARCYKESLRLESNDIRALNNLATVQEALNDYSAAERNYKKALRIEPRSAQILKNLGTNLLMQHEYGRGADAYTQALAIDSHVFDPAPGPSIAALAPVQELGTENYFQARSCARARLAECALTHLRKALNEGAATLQQIAGENDFDALREKPEFQSLLAEQK